LEELRDWEVDPSKWIEVLTDQTLWGSHPLGRDTGGSRASVRDITREHVRRFHKRFFHPANAVLSLAGPMRAAEMVACASAHFGSWRAAPGAAFPKRPPKAASEPSLRQARRARVLRRADTQQVWFSLSTTTPSYPHGHRAMLNAQLAQVLVGDGDGSRLWDGLRERLGLAYEVYATLDFYADIGVMSAKAAVGRTRAASAVRETKRILADTAERGFSKDEVARGKDALAAQIELVAEWNAANAARYAELAFFDQELLTPAQELATLATIGAREFNSFAGQQLRWDQAAVCAIGEGPALSAISG
jgi:predicted Zn-dependent peptidase